MHSFIISSKKLEQGREEALKISKAEKINKFEIEILEFEKAFGIEDVRNIQKKIFLKPVLGEKKSTILMFKNGATIEAQNSMLKLLEEPPLSSLIFIITENAKIFLPTILSRVKIIELANDENQTNSEALKELLSMESTGDRLYLAQVVGKDKNEAILWLEQVILSARGKMLSNLENKQESLKLRKLIHRLELTHYNLKTTNANLRLALENLFLNL